MYGNVFSTFIDIFFCSKSFKNPENGFVIEVRSCVVSSSEALIELSLWLKQSIEFGHECFYNTFVYSVLAVGGQNVTGSFSAVQGFADSVV